MDENIICSDSEACLQFIHSKFNSYKQILDDDQRACDSTIASIREQMYSYNNKDEKLRSLTGSDTIEFTNQLNYLEQEAFKTNEENKTCLFKMFQNLFNLHRELALDAVIINERQIAATFQYRPSVLPNIEKIRFSKTSVISSSLVNSVMTTTDNNRLIFTATSTPKASAPTPVHSTSFSNRADIEAFQHKKESLESKSTPKQYSSIESNEVDITQLVRDTYSNNTSNQFKFSNISQNLQQQQNKTTVPLKKIPKQTISCDDALLAAANKRFVLLYNMNTPSLLYVFDTEKDDTKEFHWDEGDIQSLGYVESNLFYIITDSKIFLYDIIKENLDKQYFLYDTLYKDLLLIRHDLSYQTALKRNNQIQSTVYDDCCYYLYTNKEYNQLLIKCSLDNFHQVSNLNLTQKYPHIQYFLGLTITTKSIIAFLIIDSNGYQLLFCDELHDYNVIKKLSITNSLDATSVFSTFLSNTKINFSAAATTNKNKIPKSGKQLWFVLDKKLNCIHCLTYENYLTKISSTHHQKQIQSLTIFDNKLILAYNELFVDIIDLDNYFSSLKY
ncbi:unnamed protein product [Adineta steineri]|uniref:Uncharacterized protein n=1 Tax=Adineta steineri TaxID=433720 RepID=A0A815CJP1_9BILA|nr:unnamed protein product [Adineta steineri]CAF3491381.1 unnamed protein product [Adineta steineri]